MRTDPDPGDRAFRDAVDDEVFRALRDRTRRIVLYILRTNRSLDVEELADVVTGWQNAAEPGMATRDDRDRVYTALRNCHLPVLQAAGLVEIDPSAGVVSLADLPGPVRSLLDSTYDAEEGSNGPV